MGFDAVCLLTLGLLLFSVFKFYTKGNLIIICTLVTIQLSTRQSG